MTLPRCSIRGIEIRSSNGIGDDSAWFGWELINFQLEDEPEDVVYSIEPIEPYKSRGGFPLSALNQI